MGAARTGVDETIRRKSQATQRQSGRRTGFMGLATGDSANALTPNVGDANTMIPEYKAFLVNVTKAEGGE